VLRKRREVFTLRPNLRELLEARVLFGDGAVGMPLGKRGVGVGRPYARANLPHPEMVTDIYAEHLRADAIEINTFAGKMILFINGPFGVGKTSVAKVLVQKLPHSMLYDPEVVGAVLHRILGPFGKAEDFQDYALWRPLVVEGARLLRKVPARTLLIPMTVWRRDLFDPIIAGLRRDDEDLSYFRLTASRDVLMDRIASDTEDREAYAWRTAHVEVCLKSSRYPAFGTEICTDMRTPVEIADQILKCLAVQTG
jgi:hypothetical protein